MTTVYAIHAPDLAKLAEVKTLMIAMGAPEIEVVDCGDHYMALEGSHRLAAAHALGLTPKLIVREQDEMINVTDYDWYDSANWAETNYPAGEVAGELFSATQARDYAF